MNQNTVLIVAPYSSPSVCGIWKRIEDDIKIILKSKDLRMVIFSSNILKGKDTKLPKSDKIDGIHIFRFPVLFSLGLNSLFYFHFIELLKLKPDIIHTHGYRHPHSIQALIIGKLMRKKVLITPHAPFEKDPRRPIHIKIIEKLYDWIIGWWEIRLYDKIILTTKWEKEYLVRLGAEESQIEYIPNGISKEYTTYKAKVSTTSPQKLNALYMGRLDPVKRLEWITFAAEKLPDINFTIYGPLSGYKTFNSNLSNVSIIKKKYNIDDFIKQSKSHQIYILPSVRESFGMTMLEAMALGLIVVSSSTRGAREHVQDGVNGFIANNEYDLIKRIKYIQNNWSAMDRIRSNAYKYAESFESSSVGRRIVEIVRFLDGGVDGAGE